jgi:hypothetical protein
MHGDTHRLDIADRRHTDARTTRQNSCLARTLPGIARRVYGLRMFAAKNSRKRIEARSPATATSARRVCALPIRTRSLMSGLHNHGYRGLEPHGGVLLGFGRFRPKPFSFMVNRA